MRKIDANKLFQMNEALASLLQKGKLEDADKLLDQGDRNFYTQYIPSHLLRRDRGQVPVPSLKIRNLQNIPSIVQGTGTVVNPFVWTS